MVKEVSGDLLAAPCEAVVNPINTVGVMGKGLALQFKRAFPENYEAYRQACKHGEIRMGEMFVVGLRAKKFPRFIVNFPTKRHWKSKSKLEDIVEGLKALIRVVQEKKIHTIAIPALGCGEGGLDWGDVKREITRVFDLLPEAEVLLYAPC